METTLRSPDAGSFYALARSLSMRALPDASHDHVVQVALEVFASVSRRPESKICIRDGDLRAANLRESRLDEANLSGVDLHGADLRRAGLRWADLSGADLTHALLDGADLCGANLAAALVTEASLAGARWSTQTRWSNGQETTVREQSDEISPGVFRVRGAAPSPTTACQR